MLVFGGVPEPMSARDLFHPVVWQHSADELDALVHVDEAYVPGYTLEESGKHRARTLVSVCIHSIPQHMDRAAHFTLLGAQRLAVVCNSDFATIT
jgi:hypothetical protein